MDKITLDVKECRLIEGRECRNEKERNKQRKELTG